MTGGATVSFFPTVLRRTDVYDPATAAWTRSGDLNVKRTGHTATLLLEPQHPRGRRHGSCDLAVHGGALRPRDGRLDDPPRDLSPHVFHTAALLPDGHVLVAAGLNALGLPTTSAAVFDPVAGAWSETSHLAVARVLHSMTLLPDGRVLVAGGVSGLAALSSAEVYGR